MAIMLQKGHRADSNKRNGTPGPMSSVDMNAITPEPDVEMEEGLGPKFIQDKGKGRKTSTDSEEEEQTPSYPHKRVNNKDCSMPGPRPSCLTN